MIKSSLSQSAMERLKSGGVKKLRTSKSRLRQDENHHRGAIVMDGSIVMTAKNKNNTVVKRTRNTVMTRDPYREGILFTMFHMLM